MSVLEPLWLYRGLIFGSVQREFLGKYRNSLLGATWNVLNPLAMIAVYTVVFANVMRAKLPGTEDGFAYSIYLCAGTLSWGFFTEVLNKGQTMFLDNASLLKKLSFPRITLPVIVVLNALVNFMIVAGIFIVFLLLTHNLPGLVILGALPVLILQTTLAIGLGLTLGVANVFFRDVGHFFGIFLQFWFWLTPIVYPISILPDIVVSIVSINPMTPIVSAYQGIFIGRSWPDWKSLLVPAALSVVLLLLGLLLFRKHSGDMVDEL